MGSCLEDRVIFVDEKRFEANSSGFFNLPAEDDPPQRFCQSKSNPVNVMVLIGVMKPRTRFDGVVAMHSFVQRVAAKRSSKRRESGVIELKSFHVTGETYLEAWRKTLLPALKRLVVSGQIFTPTADTPLLLQDDNARPHRKKIHGVLVSELICQAAFAEFQLMMRPLCPAQPAQSPDLNPLDTFVFRLLELHFRRIRAFERVRISARLRHEASVVNSLNAVGAVQAGRGIIGKEEDVVPLRCRPPSPRDSSSSKTFLCVPWLPWHCQED